METSLLSAKDGAALSRMSLSGGILVLLMFLAFGEALCSVEGGAGVAWPRGFYDYALVGEADVGMQRGGLPAFLKPALRLSGYFSYRDGIGLAVGSGSILLQLKSPRPLSAAIGFSPYVAAGPSLNYAYSWADLEDFGNVSGSEFSATMSVYAGADVISGGSVSLFTEARYTIPSDFTFDYVMVGLRLRPSSLPGIE